MRDDVVECRDRECDRVAVQRGEMVHDLTSFGAGGEGCEA